MSAAVVVKAQEKRKRRGAKAIQNAWRQARGQGRWTGERFWKPITMGPWELD